MATPSHSARTFESTGDSTGTGGPSAKPVIHMAPDAAKSERGTPCASVRDRRLRFDRDARERAELEEPALEAAPPTPAELPEWGPRSGAGRY